MARPNHHWVFDHFPPETRTERAGHQIGYLGETFPGRYVEGCQIFDVDRVISLGCPEVDCEYFELTDLLEAALDAKQTFTFLEAGAGFGRWSARAAMAAKHIGAQAHIVMIEGDPTHAKWAREMMVLNQVENFSLIEAALSASSGKDTFIVRGPGYENPAAWYGQSLGRSTGLAPCSLAANGWDGIEVETVTLADAIGERPRIDLIDFDIQGAEGEVIAASINILNERVRRLCIETHSPEIERDLRAMLANAGWTPLRDLPLNATTLTPFGSVTMPGGGLQSWINPRLY